MAKKRIISGLRPTGKMHLGNYLGTVSNWPAYQKDYECFFMVADWHALTTEYPHPEKIKDYTIEMLKDWLALGLEPDQSTIFVQSAVKEHIELYLLLSMFVPLPWLERNPTYKELLAEREDETLKTYGFLGYPVLQAADILIYKANLVPVGVDQLPHIELTREIARRFNFLYQNFFPIPEPKLTQVPKLIGTDGRKMSKSYQNCIYLSDEPEELKVKIKSMITDPARKRRFDQGHPEVCSIFQYHLIFNLPQTEEIRTDCESAKIGCTDCKNNLLQIIIEHLAPFREKRKALLNQEIKEIMAEGNCKAQKYAQQTLAEVKEIMKF
jgi:tryptophanyl-tRNA synthetase